MHQSLHNTVNGNLLLCAATHNNLFIYKLVSKWFSIQPESFIHGAAAGWKSIYRYDNQFFFLYFSFFILSIVW